MYCFVLVNGISISALPFSVYAEHMLALRLAQTPFNPSMCRISKENSSIRILVAKHRDLFLEKVPGQHQPKNTEEAKKKDYVHFVTLADLTGGQIPGGAIAFDNGHAVIFDDTHPNGISRPKFLAHLPENQRLIAEMALNTFLHLHPVFNAAVDACLPHPAFPDYENNDHLLRIEEGKLTFKNLVQQYNNQPSSPKDFYGFESGVIGGYVDPEAGKGANISYHAMNPLNFYVPISYP
jgi:hypothetical protein